MFKFDQVITYSNLAINVARIKVQGTRKTPERVGVLLIQWRNVHINVAHWANIANSLA